MRKQCNDLLRKAGMKIEKTNCEQTGEKTYVMISEKQEVGKKLWADNPADSIIKGKDLGALTPFLG